MTDEKAEELRSTLVRCVDALLRAEAIKMRYQNWAPSSAAAEIIKLAEGLPAP